MNERIFIKPAATEVDGKSVPRMVRKPVGGYLDPEGEEVNRESYWLRRLNDGDVVEATPPKAKKAEALPAAK